MARAIHWVGSRREQAWRCECATHSTAKCGARWGRYDDKIPCQKKTNNANFRLTLDGLRWRLAVCLDGSPPGFYFNKGSGSGSNEWLVFLEVNLHEYPHVVFVTEMTVNVHVTLYMEVGSISPSTSKLRPSSVGVAFSARESNPCAQERQCCSGRGVV